MLEDSLGHKLITILEAMRNYTKEPLAKLGITHGHFITLLYISENEGVTQAQLSEIHRKDRNLNKLIRYAEMLKCKDIINKYLEVLV